MPKDVHRKACDVAAAYSSFRNASTKAPTQPRPLAQPIAASPRIAHNTGASERRLEPKAKRTGQVGPCDSCQHLQRCSGSDLACASLELYRNAGRVSAVAPRQPSRVIFERMVTASKVPRLSPADRQRIREEQAVKNARETSYLDLVEGL